LKLNKNISENLITFKGFSKTFDKGTVMFSTKMKFF